MNEKIKEWKEQPRIVSFTERGKLIDHLLFHIEGLKNALTNQMKVVGELKMYLHRARVLVKEAEIKHDHLIASTEVLTNKIEELELDNKRLNELCDIAYS